MTFTKLTEVTSDAIWAGTVFRFPASYPFEQLVDFMLIFNTSADSGFAFVSTTGEEAGNLEAQLPVEALVSDGSRALDRNWLIENWQSHIFPSTPVCDVYVQPHYPAPTRINPRPDLADALKEWTDIDVAAYHLAVALNFLPSPASDAEPFDFGGKKHLFWTDNPTGNLIFKILDQMADIGVLEKHQNDETILRWKGLSEDANSL